MLNEYLYEIIVAIILLTSIVIYFLTRKFNQESKNAFDNIMSKNSTAVYDSYDEPEQLKTQVNFDTIEEAFILEQRAEGSFGHLNDNPFEETSNKKETPKNQEIQKQIKSSRKKIPVPKHEKIHKENFKEFAGVKLLVAEDNIINQKVISGLLNGSGIKITMADDGQVALDILEKNADFDLILMDAHMPRVDGFEATKIIRNTSAYENIVVIALSGNTGVDDIRKMKEVGMQEHLEKPLKMNDFYDILYAYTQGSNHKKLDTAQEVIMTKELNTDIGLAICGGDETFYRDILAEFITSYANTSDKLLELLNDQDIVRADALLLDFIGITANIGADIIKIIALDLKEAIKDKEEKSYLTILDDFEIHLEILLKDIAVYK
ncbi:MAG: response regulator [Helicobacteraceae bacterium]|nr:response regulator [Candidatus Sulfurimonas ponti]